MKFSIKDFFSKHDQICRKLRIWSYLLKKSLKENFIFCAVNVSKKSERDCSLSSFYSTCSKEILHCIHKLYANPWSYFHQNVSLRSNSCFLRSELWPLPWKPFKFQDAANHRHVICNINRLKIPTDIAAYSYIFKLLYLECT